jgi:hypothetical protein
MEGATVPRFTRGQLPMPILDRRFPWWLLALGVTWTTTPWTNPASPGIPPESSFSLCRNFPNFSNATATRKPPHRMPRRVTARLDNGGETVRGHGEPSPSPSQNELFSHLRHE